MKTLTKNSQPLTLLISEGLKHAGGEAKVTGFQLDSRHIKKGDAFIALKGTEADGNAFVSQAIEKGAVAIFSDQPGEADIPYVYSKTMRHDIGEVLNLFYQPKPKHHVAVTGSNGKTSVAFFVKEVWRLLGHSSASIGTLGVVKGKGKARETGLTSPDVVTLHQTLAQLKQNGVECVAMEASSHGLDQQRLAGVACNAAAFTNLSHEHLDYHGTMANYLKAKMRLFSELLIEDGAAILNADIPEYKKMQKAISQEIYSYGYKGKELKLLSAVPTSKGQKVEAEIFGQKASFTLPLIGDFQVMNVLATMGLCYASGAPVKGMLDVVEQLKAVPGRMEWVKTHNEAAVLVDYAHTPDALEKALLAARPFADGDLWVVFGCGGDRDKEKRPMMGHVAANLADQAVITDDNPRNENAESIRNEILASCPDAVEIAGRTEAICYAMNQLKPGDVLLIAGKGHETVQIVGDERFEHSDQKVVRTNVG